MRNTVHYFVYSVYWKVTALVRVKGSQAPAGNTKSSLWVFPQRARASLLLLLATATGYCYWPLVLASRKSWPTSDLHRVVITTPSTCARGG